MKKIIIALLMAMFSSAVWSQQAVEQKKPVGKLASDQVEAVQRIAQAVLGAKQSYIAPPALSAIRVELDALKGAIEQSQSVVWDKSAQLTINSQIPTANSQENSVNDRQVRHIKDRKKMDAHLQAIRTRHKELDDHATGTADDEEKTLEQGVSVKLSDLEHELEDAQAAPDIERWERLSLLAEKLTPKLLSSASKSAVPAPTISTIVEHRH